MSELKRRKFGRIMDHRDNVAREATQAISLLNAAVDKATDFSILLEEDPDQHFASNGDKEEIREDFAEVVAQLSNILPKIELIRQLKEGEITTEEFKTATGRSDFDTAAYQKSLGG